MLSEAFTSLRITQLYLCVCQCCPLEETLVTTLRPAVSKQRKDFNERPSAAA